MKISIAWQVENEQKNETLNADCRRVSAAFASPEQVSRLFAALDEIEGAAHFVARRTIAVRVAQV